MSHSSTLVLVQALLVRVPPFLNRSPCRQSTFVAVVQPTFFTEPAMLQRGLLELSAGMLAFLAKMWPLQRQAAKPAAAVGPPNCCWCFSIPLGFVTRGGQVVRIGRFVIFCKASGRGVPARLVVSRRLAPDGAPTCGAVHWSWCTQALIRLVERMVKMMMDSLHSPGNFAQQNYP